MSMYQYVLIPDEYVPVCTNSMYYMSFYMVYYQYHYMSLYIILHAAIPWLALELWLADRYLNGGKPFQAEEAVVDGAGSIWVETICG